MKQEKLLEIGIIGMGNCGGQMAAAAAEEGFDAIAINASVKDLNLLPNTVEKFGVGDGRGTGKDRNDAQIFMRERINLLQDNTVEKFLNSHDVIVIPTSIGGGFGSGSSLVIYEVLSEMYPEKAIIPAGVFPFDSEAYTAQTHAIEWLQELDRTEAAYLLYDNNRFATLPKLEACKNVNEQFAKNLCVLRGDYINQTLTGGIDNRDMMTALSAAGRIVVDTIEELDEAEIKDGNLAETILEHIKNNSAHADLVDDKEVKASAVMYTLRKNFNPYTIGLKADIQTVFGDHINDYDNFSDVEDDFNDPDMISLILSGLTLPTLRINKLISKRDSIEKSIVTRTQASSKLGSAAAGNSKLSLKAKSFASVAEPEKKQVNKTEILKKFSKEEKKDSDNAINILRQKRNEAQESQ